VQGECAFEEGDLAGQARRVHAGPPSGHPDHGGAGQDRHQRRGRGGIANAHFAGGDQVHAAGDFGLSQIEADLDRRLGLGPRHRGLLRQVPGAGRHLSSDQAGVRFQLPGDADIHDHEAGAGVTGQHTDRRPATHDVADHLRGDVRRIGADTLGRNAVIGGHDDDRFASDLGPGIACDAGQLHRQVLQPAQAARGLGQRRVANPCRGLGRLVERRDGAQVQGQKSQPPG
jgi:hypothetical protein